MGAYGSGSVPSDYDLLVAQGLIPGQYPVTVFGINPDTDTGTLPEDVWSQGGVWVPPTQARIHNIAGDVNDAPGGTGALTVFLVGLNASYNEISETVIMNGTNNVPTVNSYIFISKMYVLTAGSLNTNSGVITATAVTDVTVTNSIIAGYGESSLGVYQVPLGYTLYACYWSAGMQQATSSSSANLSLVIRPFGGAWLRKSLHSLSNSGNSFEEDVFNFRIIATEKSLIKSKITSVSNSNTLIQARLCGYLVAN